MRKFRNKSKDFTNEIVENETSHLSLLNHDDEEIGEPQINYDDEFQPNQ